MTKVVNIRTHSPTDNDVYIGRKGKGQDGYFGNPFPIVNNDRIACLDKYTEWAFIRLMTDDEFRERVKGLYGKNLVCFCAPLLCHGDALKKLAEDLNADK